MHWSRRTLRTRELPGTSEEEVMKVKLTRDDLIKLANQGLAHIEKMASEAAAAPSQNKCQSFCISNYGVGTSQYFSPQSFFLFSSALYIPA